MSYESHVYKHLVCGLNRGGLVAHTYFRVMMCLHFPEADFKVVVHMPPLISKAFCYLASFFLLLRLVHEEVVPPKVPEVMNTHARVLLVEQN